MPKQVTKVPAPVAALVSHLRSTGTGRNKLEKIEELGKIAKSSEEFYASIQQNVPPGTWMKVQEYLANKEEGLLLKAALGFA